jgi:hypothetical protein
MHWKSVFAATVLHLLASTPVLGSRQALIAQVKERRRLQQTQRYCPQNDTLPGLLVSGGSFVAPFASDTIVVAARYNEDTNWLSKLRHPVALYQKRCPSCAGIDQEVFFTLPNRGNEAAAYLHFIWRYYEQLPSTVIFVQGGETSWHHNGSLADRISDLHDLSGFLKYPGFVSLNNETTADPARGGSTVTHPTLGE